MPQSIVREPVTKEKLGDFMKEIGRRAEGPGRVYIVGGATALLLGIRNQTVDIDMKLEPEPRGIFKAIARLKEDLSLSVELASPDDFIPAVPGWQDRSEFIAREGHVEFFHYDFVGQVLAKIQRGHEKDLRDATALAQARGITPAVILSSFESIRDQLERYPGLDPTEFEAQVGVFVQEMTLD